MNDEQEPGQNNCDYFQFLASIVFPEVANLRIGASRLVCVADVLRAQGLLDAGPSQTVLSSPAGDLDVEAHFAIVEHTLQDSRWFWGAVDVVAVLGKLWKKYIHYHYLYNSEVDEIRVLRNRLCLSQAHVAFLLGTQQANVSAYEAATLTPGGVVEERMAELLALHADTVHTASWLGTCASHAKSMKESLRGSTNDEPERDLLPMRYVIGMNDSFNALLRRGHDTDKVRRSRESIAADVRLFLVQPQSTGDSQADALLAGMAVHWARAARLDRAPLWTHARHLYLDAPWWVGTKSSDKALRAQAFANGVPSLRARGIYLDRRNLESV